MRVGEIAGSDPQRVVLHRTGGDIEGDAAQSRDHADQGRKSQEAHLAANPAAAQF